jgi:uncharacterized protein
MDHERLAPTPPSPTESRNRFQSIDTLRGFALLGILVPNIVSFAWPSSAYTNPAVISDASANTAAYQATSVFFLGKFMFIFALLFGSGVIMYARKFDAADDSGKFHSKLYTGAGLWHARCAWLLFFGLIHSYLFWYGDILTFYALAGITLLWWVRRINPKLQLLAGFTIYLLATALMFLIMRSENHAIQQGIIDINSTSLDPAFEITQYTGSWLDALQARLPISLYMTFIVAPFMIPALWGIMTIGMGLTRMGILTGQRSIRFYLTAALIGIGIGLPTTIIAFGRVHQAFDIQPGHAWETVSQLIGIPLSLGYAALVIALSKWSPARFIAIPLAAVGRMALTNYFLHTILCTTFFYGYGLGYFAKVEFPQLWLVVLSVWTINIIFSMLWLRLFTMGPFEWLWRVLTYRQLVPIRAQTQSS